MIKRLFCGSIERKISRIYYKRNNIFCNFWILEIFGSPHIFNPKKYIFARLSFFYTFPKWKKVKNCKKNSYSLYITCHFYVLIIYYTICREILGNRIFMIGICRYKWVMLYVLNVDTTKYIIVEWLRERWPKGGRSPPV